MTRVIQALTGEPLAKLSLNLFVHPFHLITRTLHIGKLMANRGHDLRYKQDRDICAGLTARKLLEGWPTGSQAKYGCLDSEDNRRQHLWFPPPLNGTAVKAVLQRAMPYWRVT